MPPAPIARNANTGSETFVVGWGAAQTAAIVEQTKRSDAGRVEMGDDLMIIDIGAEVRVKPAAAEVQPR